MPKHFFFNSIFVCASKMDIHMESIENRNTDTSKQTNNNVESFGLWAIMMAVCIIFRWHTELWRTVYFVVCHVSSV